MLYEFDKWADILGSTELANKYADYCHKHTMKQRRKGRTAFKDSEQSKVYKAERIARSKWIEEGIEIPKFEDYKEARKVTKRILKSKLWKDIAGHEVEILEKKDMGYRSGTAGLAWHNKIQLCPRYGLKMDTLLHELAHSAGNAHHGLPFRLTHIKLVSRFLGTNAAKILKKSYREVGLKMGYRKTEMMTPSEWYESYVKMQKMREKINEKD